NTAFTLSRVTRVCSAMSGETICLVAGSSGPCPDTKRKPPHFTPCAMGDSMPSEKPVLGADLVNTTSGACGDFMRDLLPLLDSMRRPDRAAGTARACPGPGA